MKPGQTIFNSIAVLAAGILLFSGIISLTDSFRHQFPQHGDNFWFTIFVLDGSAMLLIGIGSLANFANRKFTAGPTVAIIAGCCLTGVLLPLAIWGLVLLRANAPSPPASPAVPF